MASTFWVAIAVISVVSIICSTLVKLAKGPRKGKKYRDLETDLAKIESELEEALERIVVLEKIVTDGKHSLRREIDDLAS